MKKSSNLLAAFITAAFLFNNIYAQPAKTAQIKPKTSDEAQNNSSTRAVTTDKIGADVAEALTLIQDNHVAGKKLDYNDLFKSSISSMLHTLDPHSSYFDAKETEQFRTDQSSRYYGIGAQIGSLSDKEGKVVATYIRATFEGAPANRAGFRYGDKIVEVNGISMLGKPSAEVSSNLRGPRGTVAKITVERHATGKRETVEIVRDAVSQPSIPEAYMIRPGIGYIAMTGSFNQTTYDEFRRAMTELKAQGMTQLVLDLRGNGGGLVNQALRVANTFLSYGQNIFTQKGRLEGVESPYPAENKNPDNTPIVMLVNRNTASASEILAGALQDHDRALIVGENTFGKGLVQNPFSLEYGSMLLLTIAKYQTPSGRLIQRDYSDGNLYNYYTDGGSLRDDAGERPKGAESKTDLGRKVYGGGGINPDEMIKPQTITAEKARFQQRFSDPLFAFTLDLAFGKVKGFEDYKVDRAITFAYDLKKTDFQITDNLYQTFKKFAAENYGLTAAQTDREREYIERNLRTELVTAAYGTTTSLQVFNEYDTQLKKAIDLLPQAKQLALESAKNNQQRTKAESNNR